MQRIITRTVPVNGMLFSEHLPGMAYQGEQLAHRFVIHAVDDSAPVALSGSVLAEFVRADGITVPVTGSIADDAAVVTLSGDCYGAIGRAELTIFVTASGATTAVYHAVTSVTRTRTDAVADQPGLIDLPALQAQFEEMGEAVEDAEEAATNANNAVEYVAPTETSPAAAAHVVGEYLIYNGTLYKVTAAIAVGDTLTAGTNIAAAPNGVAREVTDLKSALINIATDIKSLLNDIAYVRTNHQAASVASDIDDIIEALNDGSSHTIIYTITKNLSYCTSTDSTSSIVENSSYITTLIADSGYTISSVTIAMGGTDITSTAYNSATSVISVPSVTGDIVITASSSQVISPTLSSISAAFNSGGSSIYENDALDSLKQYLVVTAVYSDGSSSTVASSNYVLSGTVAAGLSTITVTYEGKYTTFDVNVSLWDTEPNIAANDSYWSTTGTAETKTGLSRTELYEYDIDLTALKSSTRYDSTNDYMTVDKSVFNIKYTFANTDGISTGQVNKNVVFSGTEFAQFSSITAGAEKGFFDAKNNTIMISNSKLKLGFTLFTAGIDDSYAYFISTNSNVMPIGVSNGDIIFAGKNTPYYHKRNINEVSHS